MPLSACPTERQLFAYHVGDLPDAVVAELSAHFERCSRCERRLEAMESTDGDAVLVALRRGAAAVDLSATRFIGAPAERKRTEHRRDTELNRPPRSAAEWPEPPGYEVLRVLGRGGMGIVYLARHRGLNRLVALKMIAPGADDPERLARFRREAETAARVQHPNLVQIYEIGEHEGRPFLALEYVPGPTLHHRLGGRPQSPRYAAEVVEALALGMQAAHEAGIIHRDLKPGNILLQQQDDGNGSAIPPHAEDATTRAEVKITDFGLARPLDDRDHLTEPNVIAGTPCYMAPEQVSGERTEVGPAADQYALGVILYQMLTGRVPIEGANGIETLTLVRTQEPVPPRRLQPRVPRDLDTICLKCLRKDPRKRYGSVGELAADLRRYLEGEPVLARPIGWGERTAKWARRSPGVALLAASVFLAVVLGVAGVAWQWREAVVARDLAERREREKEEQRQLATVARDRAESNAYFARIAQARLEWRLSHDVPVTARILEQCRPEPGEIDRRGWEWHYLQGLTRTELLSLRPHLHFARALAFSPDGREIVTAGGGEPYFGNPGRQVAPADVLVLDAETGKTVRRLLGPAHLVASIAFSSDGTTLAAGCFDGRVLFWNRDDHKPIRVLHHAGLSYVHSLAFSPDGTRLAVTHERRRVTVWDLADLRSLYTCDDHPAGVYSSAFSPDGTRLATAGWHASGSGEVIVRNADDGREIYRVQGFSRNTSGSVAFSPDGRRLAIVKHQAQILDAATGQLLHSLAGHQGEVLGLAFRPDGETLATLGADRTVRLWDTVSGAERAIFRGHGARPIALAFHPDGHSLATTDEDGWLKVWDLTRSPEHTLALANGSHPSEGIAFDATGANVISVFGGEMMVRDAVTGQLRKGHPIDFTTTWLTPAVLASFDAAGRLCAGVTRENPHQVKLWETATGKELQTLGHATHDASRHEYPVSRVALSRDGRRVASTSQGIRDGVYRRELRVWDAETGACQFRATVPCLDRRVLHGAIALNADGSLLAHDEWIDGERNVVVVRRLDRPETAPLPLPLTGPARYLSALAFSADGRLLAAGCQDGVLLWETETGRRLHEQPLRANAYQLAFHPEGSRLAGVNREELRVWDVARGRELLTLRGAPPRRSDNGYNPCLAWSADGSRLASTNWDRSISVWHADAIAASDHAVASRAAARERIAGWRLRHAWNDLRRDPSRFHFHWKRVETRTLIDPGASLLRARVHASFQRWTQAVDDFENFHQTGCLSRPEHWHFGAMLHRLAGKDEAARALAREAWQKFGDSRDPTLAWSSVRIALLNAVDANPRVAIDLAERGAQTTHGDDKWRAWHTRALACSRAGDEPAAREHLRTAVAAAPAWMRPSLELLSVAILHRDAGREADAAAALASARATLATLLETRAGQPLPHSTSDAMELLILRLHAESRDREPRDTSLP